MDVYIANLSKTLKIQGSSEHKMFEDKLPSFKRGAMPFILIMEEYKTLASST